MIFAFEVIFRFTRTENVKSKAIPAFTEQSRDIAAGYQAHLCPVIFFLLGCRRYISNSAFSQEVRGKGSSGWETSSSNRGVAGGLPESCSAGWSTTEPADAAVRRLVIATEVGGSALSDDNSGSDYGILTGRSP